MVSIPPDLLHAVAAGNGRIAFIIGAGCSHELPTDLPLSGDCAQALHDQLVDDTILEPGECDDPRNLERVADLVVQKTGGKRDVVCRLPKERFLRARPNQGHLVLAALMAEGAVGSVITINYDLAIDNALFQSGVTGVDRVARPEDNRDLGNVCLIYLHGSAASPDDEWVLTSQEVEQGWDKAGGWAEVVASRTVAAPAVVFAGVGTVVGVLRASVLRVSSALPGGAPIYCVARGNRDKSSLAQELGIPEERYVQSGWCDFALALGERVFVEHVRELGIACESLRTSLGVHGLDLKPALGAIRNDSLVGFGAVRAAWFLHEGDYYRWAGIRAGWVAQLVVAVAQVAAELGAEIELRRNGTFSLSRNGVQFGVVGCLHGQAERRMGELEAEINQLNRRGVFRQEEAVVILVAGMAGMRPEDISTPSSLLETRPADDLLSGPRPLRFVHVDSVAVKPDILQDIMG